jgi:NADPH:quinone reductase
MTRVVRIHRPGGPEELRLDDVPLGEPGAGEALVRHTAIGVNYIDVYHRTGLYPLPTLPHALGVEAAGVVEALGPGVEEVKLGQRIAYVTSLPGSYAEARVVKADRLVALPDAISDEAAAAMMLKGMTVEFLVRRAYPVKAGQTVLLHAAAGGVGLIASQWLRDLGVTVIGTVGSDAKAELARAHGCTHPIVYTRENFVERVRTFTAGKGVPVVYDSVGKSTFNGSLDCLAPRGMLVVFGNASGKPDPLDVGVLAQKGSLFLTRPTLFSYIATREELLASAAALFDVVKNGRIAIRTAQRWPLAEAAAAHRALETRATTGSSLLIP